MAHLEATPDIARWVVKNDDTENATLLNIQNQCKHYTTVDIPKVKEKFSVLHVNARSLKNKFDVINIFLDNSEVDWSVICVSETWLKEEIIKYYNLDKYNLFASCRQSGEGGGTAIYVNSQLKAKPRKDLEANNFENTFVEIEIAYQSCKKHIIIGEVYRPPNFPHKEFLDHMEIILDKMENENKFSIISGDFNYNFLQIQDNKKVQLFFNLFKSYGFQPTIWKPTRITNNTEAILDNIFVTNFSSLHSSGIILEDWSDHFPIFFILELEHKSVSKSRKTLVFNKRKMPDLNKYLENKLQNFQLNTDPNIACNELISAYEDGIKLFSNLIKRSRRKTPIKPWITPGILCSINKKNKLYKKFLTSGSREHENIYKKYRNVLVKIIREAKRLYFFYSFKASKGDSKETWKLLNDLLNRKKSKTNELPSTFKNDNGKLIKGTEMSNAFNNFFSSVGVNLEKTIPSSHSSPLHYVKRNVNNTFTDHFYTTSLEVCNIIKELNPVGGGIDKISTQILVGTYSNIIEHLTFFFNLCLHSAVFPDLLKIAIIKPIYKSGSKEEFTNYRPISLLPILSKVLEKIIYKNISSFLESNNILTPFQFGFRKKHSTYMPLAKIYEDISKSLQNKEIIFGLYLDLKKAFDTVNIDILLQKLNHVGIQGDLYNLIKSYLTERFQITRVNDTNSDKNMIKIGVPQGSILGPLLFLIYINDITNVSKDANFFLFADDTANYKS